jgi:hypothetical protein
MGTVVGPGEDDLAGGTGASGRPVAPHPGYIVRIERRRRRRWVGIAEIRAPELSRFRYVKRLRGLRRRGERFRAVVRADAAGRAGA